MIKGKKITLRPLEREDWKKTIVWRNNISIKKLAMMHPFPITEMNELGWYEELLKSKSDKNLFFAIVNENSETIGFISLNNINRTNRNCYLSIVIGDENNQGKGYGKEAMEIILDYAFKTLNLIKVSLEVNSSNEKAINLYKKLSFIEEGRLKRHFFSDRIYHDVLILSCFRSEK